MPMIWSTLRLLALVAYGLLCFLPPLLLLWGVVPDMSGPQKVSSWSMQGLASVWWGRVLMALAWLVLGSLCFWGLLRGKK
jgi:hypothetical protein